MPSEGCWCVQTALLLFDFEVQPGDVSLFEVAEGFIEVADGRRMVADDDDFRAFHFGASDQIRQLVEELGVQAEIAAEVGFGGQAVFGAFEPVVENVGFGIVGVAGQRHPVKQSLVVFFEKCRHFAEQLAVAHAAENGAGFLPIRFSAVLIF
ncbi:hypothetical protein F9Z39_1477 [Neisseria gonorrhoeae]|nr:hypothetical protein F9Z35_0210 [Neisseria gonorrhoeae]KAE9496886.1 hypothetical protein F9Z37_0200 [Neisseria gonorrhoeae]KAE9502631.1 hypothetical protein F9Z38_0413 [Neisseria gonorrhoeae]KAE9503374.1 hypothetical protein F9Z39_1477 [Neisseria gonorrhoeae]KAE9504875.1 hypothetical protein F9Z40_0193 [Neisseria gonorrhoeae]